MPTTLYIEPFSGIAGDMLLSALCSLADAYEEILQLPEKLHLHDAKIEIQQLNKNGIACRHIKIIDTSEPATHDHTGHSHGPHRHLSDILALIDSGSISDRAKTIAKAVFQIIGESESRIHDIPLERIHFHEVSGVDSILDIVGCAVLLDRLEIGDCYCDPICVGFGSVNTQHGLLPVPAPATADILRGLPSYKGDEVGERCTPTGAALLKYLSPKFEACPRPAKNIAYGPGQKDFQTANVVRVSLLQPEEEKPSRIWVLETNLDDMPPEALGLDFQRGLLAHGALDFHFTPVQMKKGRPGLLLSALSAEEARDNLADYILEHTSSIGLRFYPVQRRELKRRKFAMSTKFGTVMAKETQRPSGTKTIKFEYESLQELANQNNLTLREMQQRLARVDPPAHNTQI